MITVSFNDKEFFKDLMNIAGYSEGFLEGIQKGKPKFLKSLAINSIQIFKEFVDQNARADQQMYNHIYEWYQVGNPDARLFDLNYIVSESGISFNSTFSQSMSIANGSTVPFYNKAEIMEKGLPVTIRPVNAKVLNFKVDNEEVFTAGPITVQHPGGTHVAGSFEHIFNLFFNEHFSQSVLHMTGITAYLKDARVYKDNLHSAKTGGKAKGVEVGYNWIVKAGDLSV